MKTLPARDVAEAEAPFHAPDQLALAMPLIAVLGLVVVVSAVTLGASGSVVALVAVGGFGLCAVAPMALIEALVNRPLREALAQLRAARDGRPARGAVFASGVIADLVHIARDLQAAQAHGDPGSLTPFEALAAASEEAVRAVRQQAESVAEAAAEGESQINRAAQGCFADIAEAIKSMRDAPAAAGFDGAVERLESMLVYIAETQERAEAKDRHFEGAFGRVEVGMTDLARLVARETETVQGALSSNGLLVRSDIADGLAQDKGGRARVLERLDTLETRLSRSADGVAGEVGKLAGVIRAEVGRLSTSAGDGRLADIAAALSRLEAAIAPTQAEPAPAEAIGEDLRGLTAQVARLGEEFAARAPVDAALRGLSEALAVGFQEADLAGLRAEVRQTAAAVAGQVETLRVPAPRNDLSAELAAAVADLSRPLADIGARLDALGGDDRARDLAQAARGLIETAARLEAQPRDRLSAELANAVEALGARVEEMGRLHAQSTQDAVREIAARTPQAWERVGAEVQAVARAVEALDGRLESKAPNAFTLATDTFRAAADRLELAQARLVAQADDAPRLAETVERALAQVAAGAGSAAQRQSERLDDFARETIDPARDALAALRARFEADGPALAHVAEATHSARAQLDALAQTLPRVFAETAEAQVERLAARLDAATLAPARDALAQAQDAFRQSTEACGAAQGRLTQAVVSLEAGDPRLAALDGRAEAIRSQIDGLAEAMRVQADELGARLDSAALTPARAALAQATESFEAAQARLALAVETIEAGDPRLAALARATGALRGQIEGLAETLDAAGLAPARDAMVQATESFVAGQARLAGAVEKIEAGDPRLTDLARATGALRGQIDGLAQTLDAAGLAPARDAMVQATESFVAGQARLAGAVEKIEAGDPRLADLVRATGALRGQIDGLAQTLDAAGLAQATQSFGVAQAQLAQALGSLETGDPRLAQVVGATTALQGRIGDLAEALRSQGDDLAARLDAAALTPARDAFTQATQSFAAAQTRLTQAAAKVEAGDPRLAHVAEAAKVLRVEFAALAQNLPDALCERVGAAGLIPARDALAQAAQTFDSARSRLDEGAESLARLRGDLVASEARLARLLEDADARVAALGLDRLPDLAAELAETQAQWRARLGEFDRSAGVLAGLAEQDAHAVAALRDAFEAVEGNLHAAIVGLAPVVEAALAAHADGIVRAMEVREHAGARELGQAFADLHARLETPAPLDTLRADLAASAQTVASRFDAAVHTLARQIEERVESLRRGEFALAALALQASTQDLGKAQAELFGQVDALKAALAGDRSAFAALRQDVALAFASVAAVGERADASMHEAAERADALSASVRDLAGAERAELAALAQALGKIGERVEYAARAFEERRGGDLATLGADLTRDIDALARVTAERVLALEGGVETLAHAAGATLTQVREAARALSRLQAPFKSGAASSPDATLVAAMADALDVRFSQIEAALSDLSARLIAGDPSRLDADVGALAEALKSASLALKTGLADFAGASAAWVETSAPAPATAYRG